MCRRACGAAHVCLHYLRLQARLVWESLLYVQPGLWSSSRGRASLEALVAARLEDSHFSHCAAAAERKRLVGGGIAWWVGGAQKHAFRRQL